MANNRFSIDVRNSTDRAAVLCIEPRADEAQLDVGEVARVEFVGEQRGEALEVVIAPGRITLYGWTGSISSVARRSESE